MVTRIAGESGPCSAWVIRSAATRPRVGRWRGEDHPLRRPGRQVDADLAHDLDLGRRHPGVARADDPVDRLDPGLGQAVGQRADRLGAAGDDERVDLEQAGGPSRTGSIAPSRPAGEATTMAPTPATRAGTTVMTSDDGYGAEPPGT